MSNIKSRQSELQPKRFRFAIQEIEKLGFQVFNITTTSLQIIHKNQTVTFFPYTGWATGKSIHDGRGIDNLLKQLKSNT